jgi:hypothetical protein
MPATYYAAMRRWDDCTVGRLRIVDARRAQGPWIALREPSGPVRADVRPRPAGSEETRHAPELACVSCLGRVTTRSAKIQVGGAHEHTFTNPHGFLFHIGCFAEAPGCLAAGGPMTDFSWFVGYSWEIEHCRGCGEHLGWLFRSSADLFHGLILDRLVEIDSDQPQ